MKRFTQPEIPPCFVVLRVAEGQGTCYQVIDTIKDVVVASVPSFCDQRKARASTRRIADELNRFYLSGGYFPNTPASTPQRRKSSPDWLTGGDL